MRSGSSLSRRGVLLIAIISPALLGSEFKCVAVSNPSVATARIEQIEPIMPRVGDIMRATGSGNGAPPLQFAWDFGDGALAGGMQAAHAYVAPGSYRVTLTVRDATGNTASDSSQVAVSARVSSSVLSLVLVSNAVAGQPVLFAALPLEENASALSYVWTFSDGQSAIGPRAAATFPVAGMYLASVTVTNDFGAIAVAQTAFHVVDAAH
jgi:PKD repeat protein